MMKRPLVVILGSVALAALVLMPPLAGGPAVAAGSVVIEPATPVQGDTIAVLVHAPAGSRVAVRFNGAALSVFSAGEGTWRALRGTDPDTPSGTYPVAVAIRPAGGRAVTVRRMVTVGSTRFAERHLTLPKGTVSLITPQNLAMEARALHAALSHWTPQALWHGPFHLPVTGVIDSPYGYMGYYNGVREWWHQGVDFPLPAGAPVAAPADGIVVLARPLALGGHTVIIDHGQGVFTEFLHLSAFAVHEGERVTQGQTIAQIGATGLVTGPSLHWGLYAGGRWVNPLFWTTSRPGLTD
jgi:hypothetical protein